MIIMDLRPFLQIKRNRTFPGKYITKIHESAGHLASSHLEKRLPHVGEFPGGTWKAIDKVRSRRSVCAESPKIPGAPVYSGEHSSHFNRRIGMDLLLYDSLASPHMVDIDAHFTAAWPVCREKSQLVA